MPGNALLRRLGIERLGVLERAVYSADSGLWLALRIDTSVTFGQLSSFLDQWKHTGLASITDVVVPPELATAQTVGDRHFTWFTEMEQLTKSSDLHPLIPAAAKGAERLCGDISDVVVGLDEATPVGFVDPCLGARAEREKSFVRCAKALLKGVAHSRIERVTLWTSTPRVIASCRAAARALGLKPGDRYAVCLPESHSALAANLLRDGEGVRMWWTIDQSAIERTVGQ